jgi:hypothetical protein
VRLGINRSGRHATDVVWSAHVVLLRLSVWV